MESVKVPEFEMDFCHLLRDPKAETSALWTDDVAAQNPMCAALSTMSDENAYLSALRTAFVKRMAYAKAVLKVDPEPALKLLVDKIALRASADGSQLKVETAPRFSSQASVQSDVHKTQWKVRFDACGSSWKHVSRWK